MVSRSVIVWALAIATWGTRPAAGIAQARAGDRPGVTRVTGMVYDSLSRLPLAGAYVQIVPRASHTARDGRRTAVSDSAGRFAFAGIDRGTFLIGFFHPKLDSLGIEAPLAEVEVRGDAAPAEQRVDLAVPGARTVVGATCAPGREGWGVVLGYVREAASERPVARTHVRARWSEIIIGRGATRARVQESRVRTSDAGWFALCGVPPGGIVLLDAATRADSGAPLEIEVPGDGVVLRDIYVSHADEGAPNAPPAPNARAAPNAASAPNGAAAPNARGSGTAALRGVVRDPQGEPIAGARVRLWGSASEARSDAGGEFLLSGLPGGTRMVELRALGYAPRRALVDLKPGQAAVLEVPLVDFASALDTIRILGRDARIPDQLAGFEARRRGGHGIFLDPNAVEARKPIVFTDLMRALPGVEVVPAGGSSRVAMRGFGANSQCEPELIIDGMRVPRFDMSLDELIPAGVVRALEVYPRRIQAPPEYQALDCGSIVVWTGARGWLAKRLPKAPKL